MIKSALMLVGPVAAIRGRDGVGYNGGSSSARHGKSARGGGGGGEDEASPPPAALRVSGGARGAVAVPVFLRQDFSARREVVMDVDHTPPGVIPYTISEMAS
eukprot:295371-Prorocentrum_minimum.AAC.1